MAAAWHSGPLRAVVSLACVACARGTIDLMTETEIRKALISKLASGRDAAGAAFIAELFVDGFARRADLVMANGKLAAFEIKSERDSLDRLEGQLSTYERLFEQVTVVCAMKHLDGVFARVGDAIGIWAICPEAGVTVVRPAVTTPVIDKGNWLTFLPVDELTAMLKLSGKRVGKTRADMLAEAEGLALTKIRAFVLDYLKRREERIAGLVELKAQQRRTAAPVPSTSQAAQRVQAFIDAHAGAEPMRAIPRRKAQSSSP